MLRVENIKKSYQIREDKIQSVLNGLSVTFEETGFVSILGSSGNGKTTLLNIIGGLDSYDSGSIYYNNEEIKNYASFRRQKIGFVFQEYNLIEHLNIVDNVILSISDEVKNKEEKAKEILTEVGLEEHFHKHPNQLSGGQKQRVAIARMIVKDVKIIVCDEPTGNLDEAIEDSIAESIKKLSKDRLVLLVTHNRNLAERYSDRIIELEDGMIVKDTGTYEVEKHSGNGTRKSFQKNLFWLAMRNLKGRYKETFKNVIFSFVIMLLASLSIVLNSGTFTDYMHNIRIENGVKNMVVAYDEDVDYEAIKSVIDRNENVAFSAYNYDITIGVAPTNFIDARTNVQFHLEDATGNEYLKESITHGRFPEEPNEILLSATNAITLLVELNIGGERLEDQFMTGEMDNDYVYSIIDDKSFIITEYDYPGVTVVGLLDDTRVHEDERQVFYFIDGFLEMIDHQDYLVPDTLNIYKSELYHEENNQLINYIENMSGVSVVQYHQDLVDVEYNKIESFLQFAEIGLYTVIVLASVAYVSLLFHSLSERKYEIGLYRSIGYKGKSIRRVLSTEMLLSGLISILFVLIVLFVFALSMYYAPYNKLSLLNIINEMNILYIMISMVFISVITTTIVIYVNNKRNLSKTIISNISEL